MIASQRLLSSALAAVFALSCSASAVTAAPTPAANTLLFGAAVSLTGRESREGRLTQEGYDLWKDYVNAHGGIKAGSKRYMVDIKYYDDETNPQTAARLAEKLIDDDHVNFMLGPYGSSSTFSVAGVVERKKIPMVDANGAAEKIFQQGYRYTFGVLSPGKVYLQGIVDMALHLKPRPQTIAISSANDAFPSEAQAGAIEYATQHGLKVVYSGKYPVESTDLSPVVSAIKAANPDVILGAGHLQDSLLMQRGLKDQNVQAKLYGYTIGPDTPDFRQALGKDANYVVGGTQWTPHLKYNAAPGFYQTGPAYAAAFQAKYGRAPDYHNAESSAGCLAFQYAIERAGTIDTEAVRDALAKLDVVTFFGILKFDSRGLNAYKPMAVNQIQDGKLVLVWPAGVADGKPKYPTPPWGSR